MSNAYLILENGAVFKGKPFGYDAETVGELVFSTKMTGYLETISDPAYFGQIVLQTFPLIGNYGVIPHDLGPGPLYLNAYIVRQWCQEPSNFRSEGNLDSFLCDHKTPGLYDIDTRALTRIIRENGSMNAMLSKSPELTEEQRAKLREHKLTGTVAAACEQSNYSPGNHMVRRSQGPSGQEAAKDGAGLRVALWDFGDGFRASQLLASHGCTPVTIRHDASASSIMAQNPDGVMLTGGPGDPAENVRITEEIRKLCVICDGTPIFAAGLGHQMLALARGARTEKLKFGNRGANVPVLQCGTKRAFVTEQNHGHSVASGSLPENAQMSYININDGTCEGINYTDIPAFSIQFDPTDEIINRFTAMMTGKYLVT